MVSEKQGVWYFPGKLPAVVVKMHASTMVDIVIDDQGTVYKRTSVPVWDGSGNAPLAYVKEAASDDLPDLDAIRRDRTYGLPGQQGGADQGGASDDTGPGSDDGA